MQILSAKYENLLISFGDQRNDNLNFKF